MKHETKAKVQFFLFGILALPVVVGIIVVATYVRKVSSEFWLSLIGY
jgi:hypothetical protein